MFVVDFESSFTCDLERLVISLVIMECRQRCSNGMVKAISQRKTGAGNNRNILLPIGKNYKIRTRRFVWFFLIVFTKEIWYYGTNYWFMRILLLLWFATDKIYRL